MLGINAQRGHLRVCPWSRVCRSLWIESALDLYAGWPLAAEQIEGYHTGYISLRSGNSYQCAPFLGK